MSIKYPALGAIPALLPPGHALIVVATSRFDGSHDTPPGVGLLIIAGGETRPSQAAQSIVVEVIHETIKDESLSDDELII